MGERYAPPHTRARHRSRDCLSDCSGCAACPRLLGYCSPRYPHGAVTMRDTAADADTVSVYGEGLPVYQTAAACQTALRHAIQKYAGRSHAEGNFGRFLCVDWRNWTTSTPLKDHRI